MERYTKRLDDGRAIMNCQDCDTDWTNKHAHKCTVMYCRDRLKDRVAEYEDTGLEPWEIERIVDAYGRCQTLRTESALRLEIIREISTERLKEIAEKEYENEFQRHLKRFDIMPKKPETRMKDFLKRNKNACITKKNIPVVCAAKMGYLDVADCCTDCYKCWNENIKKEN